MKRPCICDRATDGPYDLTQCRVCWLARNDVCYMALWEYDMTGITSWLAFAERLAEKGRLPEPNVRRELHKLLGPDWSEFAARHGLDANEFGPAGPGQPRRVSARPPGTRPRGSGPGTELAGLLAELHLSMKKGCGCADKARLMDRNGIAWCREHREEIADWLRAGAGESTWVEKVTAAVHAVASGVAFRLSVSDPFGSLVDESIRRAEEKQQENPSAS